jgi:hypothetical protein
MSVHASCPASRTSLTRTAELLAENVVVYDVPPSLVKRERRRHGVGDGDQIHAHDIARAVLGEYEKLVPLAPT